MNPLNSFPSPPAKILSLILIIIIAGMIYHEWRDSPFNRTNDLVPGTKEYLFYHDGRYDTISQERADKEDTIPTVLMHYWFKDSNNVWHEDKYGGRTDSSDFKKD